MGSRKLITIPERSEMLAEFLGIMIGDGSISRYQASISLNYITDWEFGQYIVSLIRSLFSIEPALHIRENLNCLVIVVSSVQFVDFLLLCGLPIGDKIRAGLDVPVWISQNSHYLTACLRGIFDTDGSIYQEIHTYRLKKYAYMRTAFVSASYPLIESIFQHLNYLQLNPKIRGMRKVTIERFTDIDGYFRIVGSSNPKHIRRFTMFGGVG